MSEQIIPAYAHLNARIAPLDRCQRYEEPLMEELDGKGWAEVTGGGSMQEQNGEISYCGIDIDLLDVDLAVPFICEVLGQCGAPKGSKLQYEHNGDKHEVPFGFLEGLAIYLNGKDLPDKVYAECDSNHVYDEINRLLDKHGEIQGHWQGPTETGLYLYGYSAEEMKTLVASLMKDYPLCQEARVEVIA